MNYFLDLFEKYPEAEGVDFIPLTVLFSPLGIPDEICQSNLKEDFAKNPEISIPKTPYLLWKKVNGKKVYIDWLNEE